MKEYRARVCALLMAAVFLLACVPATLYAQEAGYDVTIRSAQELLAFAQSCSLDSWSRGKTVLLAGDIDLSDCAFTPIPTFGGTFDGSGYTIFGLNLSGNGSNQGLFRYVQSGGAVKDLTVQGTVAPGGSRAAVGGIAGNNAGVIQDCKFQGNVKGETNVGGIAGVNQADGKILRCKASGTVQGMDGTGGVCGRNLGTLLKCENESSVNTASPDNSVSIEEINVDDMLDLSSDTEKKEDGESDKILKMHNDTGGLAGYSSGIVQDCTNSGQVGYPHVGYNVGGVAGRQNGYMVGCTNTGAINGRKDVGGVAGQSEPYIILNMGTDRLKQLRDELDQLKRLIDQTANHADQSSADFAARMSQIGDLADGARDNTKSLVDSVGNFVDNNVGSLNSLSTSVSNALDEAAPAFDSLATASEELSNMADELETALDLLAGASDVGQQALEEAKDAVNALRPTGTAMGDAAKSLQKAAADLEDAVMVNNQAAVDRAIKELARTVQGLGNAVDEAGDALDHLQEALRNPNWRTLLKDVLDSLEMFSDALKDMGWALKRAGNALETIQTEFNIDWNQIQSALRNASNAMGDLHDATDLMDTALSHLSEAIRQSQSVTAELGDALRQLEQVTEAGSAMGQRLKDAFTTMGDAIDHLAADTPVEFYPLGEKYQTASTDLYNHISGISKELSALNEDTQSASNTLTADLRAINNQLNTVFALLIDSLAEMRDGASDFQLSDYIVDTSDDEINATKQGKLLDCKNYGIVAGDRNVGGGVGTMAIEYSLDPEDDLGGRPTLNLTYETKSVLQNCKNYGSITAKKDCAGGLVGRMSLGTVTDCEGYGPVTGTDGDYIGGVAGISTSTVRNSWAKCRLSGKDYVGGIAGQGTAIRDCNSIVTFDAGTEWLGAIAGDGDVQTGKITGNYFVGAGIAGIDSISYAGCAEPVEFEGLRSKAGVPEEFLSFTLTLQADGAVVGQIPFQYGTDPAQLQLPEAPKKDDAYGLWPELGENALTADMTLEAVYKPWDTIIASEETAGNLALALAEGRFDQDAALRVENSDVAPPKASKNSDAIPVWSVSLTGTETGRGDEVPIRLLDEQGGGKVYQYEAGQWHEVAASRNGRYLQVTMTGSMGVFSIQPSASRWLWYGIGGLVLLLLALLGLYFIRKWKKK